MLCFLINTVIVTTKKVIGKFYLVKDEHNIFITVTKHSQVSLIYSSVPMSSKTKTNESKEDLFKTIQASYLQDTSNYPNCIICLSKNQIYSLNLSPILTIITSTKSFYCRNEIHSHHRHHLQ